MDKIIKDMLNLVDHIHRVRRNHERVRHLLSGVEQQVIGIADDLIERLEEGECSLCGDPGAMKNESGTYELVALLEQAQDNQPAGGGE